jgi:hypothetical protein
MDGELAKVLVEAANFSLTSSTWKFYNPYRASLERVRSLGMEG